MSSPATTSPMLSSVGTFESPEQIADALDRRARWISTTHRVRFLGTWLAIGIILVGSLILTGRIDVEFYDRWAAYIIGGVPLTFFLSSVSIVLALVLAVIGALGRLSSRATISGVASFYVSFVRGTPLIVQILFVFLALPQLWEGFARISPVILGIFALGFNYGAYTTEILRAGIEAVPRGQREAAQALGMTDSLVLRRIVAPQAFRIVVPALGNQFISMMKDSSLVSVISVQELLWRARVVGQSNFRSLETLIFAAALYWIMTILLSSVQNRLERRMAKSDAGR